MPQDPYAAYGGQVVNDPYKAYGGSVATASMEMTPESLGVTPGLPGSKPAALQGAPTFTDRLHATSVPGSFEGHPENMAQYVTSGPGEVLAGTKDIATGKVAKGAHRVISGVGATAMPMSALVLPAAAMAAPISTAIGVGGGIVGGAAGQKIAETAGATPDQASLAGDVGSLAGGIGAAKAIDLLKAPASRLLLLGKTPQGAYESALKPSTTIPADDRARMVQTGLNEGIPISKGGLNKLGELIDDLNSKITDVVNSKPNVLIDPKAVASRMKPTAARFAEQVNPQEDLGAIAKSKAQFLDNHTDSAPYTKIVPSAESDGFLPIGNGVNKVSKPLTAPEAQAEKTGTYRVLRDKYGELGSASTEAQKALARGLKEEIATQFPELTQMNAREGAMLDLQDVLERAVNRNANHQLIGIGTPAVTGAVKLATDSNKLAATAGVMKAVLDNPAVKSRLAIALIKAGASPETAVQRMNAYVGALSQSALRGSGQPDGSPPSQ